MTEQCPNPETLARFVENSLDAHEHEAVIVHVAECVVCRRHVAIASLPDVVAPRYIVPLSMRRKLQRVWSMAATLLAGLALWFALRQPPVEKKDGPIVKRDTPAAQNTVVTVPQPEPEPPRTLPIPPRTEDPLPPMTETPVPPPPPMTEQPAPHTQETPTPEPPKTESTPTPEPPKTESTPVPEPPKPRSTQQPTAVAAAFSPGKTARVVAFEPWGGLKIESKAGAKAADVEGSSVVSSEARLLARTRAGGVRLANGTRIQLAPGATASIYRSEAQKCACVRVHEGDVLVELPAGTKMPLFVARGAAGGLLEDASGLVMLSAGGDADALHITPLSAALACRPNESDRQAVGVSETTLLQGGAASPAKRDARISAHRARFGAFPKESPLVAYLSFEPEFAESENVFIAQGRGDDGGFLVGALNRKLKKRVIEIQLADPLPRASGDLLVRIRFRTQGIRLELHTSTQDVSMMDGGSIMDPVPSRSRSATEWASTTIVVPSSWWSMYGTVNNPEKEKRKILVWAELPSGIDPEKAAFEIDEIEITKRQ